MSTQRQETKEGIQQFLQDRLKNVTDAFGAVDDAYMGAARKHVLRLPDEGTVPDDGFMPGVRNALGSMLFQARTGATGVNPVYQYRNLDKAPDWQAKSAMFANRALHAGGITAAGAGLVELTGAIGGSFGSPADEQTPRQIQM